ncbi:MAG: hypothetical protein ACI92G_001792 [Candidatus Pelagisphaera sp.]|jgi:hypothetical protein
MKPSPSFIARTDSKDFGLVSAHYLSLKAMTSLIIGLQVLAEFDRW